MKRPAFKRGTGAMRRRPSRLGRRDSLSTNISDAARGPVHTPGHARYFSIVQRKVLTPNDFATLAPLEHYVMAVQHRYRWLRGRSGGRLPAPTRITPRQTREDSRRGVAGGMIRKIRHRNSEILY
jgi:hypothetical protein